MAVRGYVPPGRLYATRIRCIAALTRVRVTKLRQYLNTTGQTVGFLRLQEIEMSWLTVAKLTFVGRPTALYRALQQASWQSGHAARSPVASSSAPDRIRAYSWLPDAPDEPPVLAALFTKPALQAATHSFASMVVSPSGFAALKLLT